MKRFALLLLITAGCSDPNGPTVARPPNVVFVRAGADPTHIVWSVVPGVAVAAMARMGINPSVVWSKALHGAAAVVSAADSTQLTAAGILVTTNGTVTLDPEPARTAPSWGLDRIDQTALPLDNSYSPPNEGAGVTAYIIDTGMEITHGEFGGRASNGFDAIDGTFNPCHYHSTHVAGIVGGATVGVANQVAIVSVRVLGCGGSGTWAQVISGIEWVTANAVKPAVANMSLTGRGTEPLTPENDPAIAAVENSIASGITYAIASGNDWGDACYNSPAAAPNALTANASTATDGHAAFSNWGSCTDLYAPGASIYSAWQGNSYTNLSGTSMAAPHVAGAVAHVLSVNPSWSPAQVNSDILARATPNVVSGAPAGTPNFLLYTGTIGEPPPPPPPTECPPGTRLRGKSGKCR